MAQHPDHCEPAGPGGVLEPDAEGRAAEAVAADPGQAAASGHDAARDEDGAGGQDGWRGQTQAELRDALYALRARARSRGLIDMAQGIVMARYRLADPRAAFALLKQVSQFHNVSLRVFSSALVAAPAPPETGPWFPGRHHAPPPPVRFLSARGFRPRECGKALQAAVDEAVAATGADAGTLHLADSARGGALFLEAQRRHGPAYCDAYARITSPATAVARAFASGRPVADTEAAPPFAGHPGDHSRLGGGFHTVHAVPLAAGASSRMGALAVQHRHPGRRLDAAQHAALLRLSAETTAWHSWYRRTVLLDALEHLHTEATTPHHP